MKILDVETELRRMGGILGTTNEGMVCDLAAEIVAGAGRLEQDNARLRPALRIARSWMETSVDKMVNPIAFDKDLSLVDAALAQSQPQEPLAAPAPAE